MAKYSSRAIDPLSLVLAALADPTRRAIVEKLASGEATVNTLAKPLKMSLPGVSKHLKVLQKAGLVVQGRDAQRRPCRLNPKRIQDVANWAEVASLFEQFPPIDVLVNCAGITGRTNVKSDETDPAGTVLP